MDELMAVLIFFVVVVGLIVAGIVAVNTLDASNDPEVGIDAGVDIICSEDYHVGFWFITKGSYSYVKSEKMTETEYAKYCVK